MRIITGKARGKRLQTPGGLHTRPTTERVKESVFSIVQWDIEGRKALDLFGGSGQLGLEAVSRGAESCVIVESDRGAQKVIESNIRGCKFESQCRLVCGDAFQFLQRQKKASFGLIFLDPPYGGELLNRALCYLADHLEETGQVRFLCFRQDENKPGGSYVWVCGRVKKLDLYRNAVMLENGEMIFIENIRAIEGVEWEQL